MMVADKILVPTAAVLSPFLAPTAVVHFDLHYGVRREIPRITDHLTPPKALWVLFRFAGDPLGALIVTDPAASDDDLAVLAQNAFGHLIDRQFDHLARTGSPIAEGRRRQTAASSETMTIVLCTTGDRPEGLERCLDSLRAQSYKEAEVLIVDNSPTGSVRSLVSSFLEQSRFRYIHEPRRGLAHARNASIHASSSSILAWLDDDEVADDLWSEELLAGFLDEPDAAVVCGFMAPAELCTEAQLWFEQWGGHSKGRGLVKTVFRPGEFEQSPLYPLPAFGSGGNMAYRRTAIERIGGFDVALGAGTPAMGAEDSRAFTTSLLAGDTLVFLPSAITSHYHRATMAEFGNQLRGYGIGLTAFYTSLIWSRPSLLWPLLLQAPNALRDLRSPHSVRNATLTSEFPKELMAGNRRGMLSGPTAYLRGRLANRAGSRTMPPMRGNEWGS
jgi:glycosyltransferase involved in cell wall biosynthesis